MSTARILVVEDEAIVAADIAATLRKIGHEVLPTADNVDEAVAMAQAHRPDLVLLDIRLKGAKDGIMAGRLIRGSLGIPIVYLTAHADELTLRRARHTEPYAYVVKPFNEHDLRSALEIALHKHRLERSAREREELLSNVLRFIGDAVVCCDGSWRIVSFNAAAEALTGWTSAEALARPLGEVIRIASEAGTEVGRPALDGRALEEAPGNVERVLVTRDDRRVPVSETIVPLYDYTKVVRGVILVLKDLSELRRLERAAATVPDVRRAPER